jgi:hypothetical protein
MVVYNSLPDPDHDDSSPNEVTADAPPADDPGYCHYPYSHYWQYLE